MEEYDPPLGEELKTARLAAGYSQAELAAKLGVTHSAISGWENGKQEPGYENARRLAEVLDGVDPSEVDPADQLQLGTRGREKEYSMDDIMDALRRAKERTEYQRLASTEYDRVRDEDDPCTATVMDRFESWEDARTAIDDA